MPEHDEILKRALEIYHAANPHIPTTPEEDELKEGSYWNTARDELMSGSAAALREYLNELENAADEVRKELGIEKPLPTDERLTELENQLATIESRYNTTKDRLKAAEEELRKIHEAKPPPAPVKSYEDLQKEFAGKDAVDALAIFVSRYRGLVRDYLIEDLNRYLRELRAKLTTEDLFRFYKVYPNLLAEFISLASMIEWIPPPPPPPTGLTPEQKEALENLFKSTFIEAGASYTGKLAEFRTELERLQEDLKNEPRPRAYDLAQRAIVDLAKALIPYKPPTPIPPPAPVPVPVTAVPVRVAIREARVRELRTEPCLTCRRPEQQHTIDVDLIRRVSEGSDEFLGAGRVRHVPPVLKFPYAFYHMCPDCRFERYGYTDIYDALAYLLAEGRRSEYKKVKVTKDTLRAIGLDETDLNEIQALEAKYRISP
jgi:hypothetical protein